MIFLMRLRCLLSIAVISISALSARAQFYLAGDDPGAVRWNYILTPNYKVIYPKGLDSLSRAYAKALESARMKVGMSAGYIPGETYGARTQVVLHAYTGDSNGSVAWAPMRMDLNTLPEAYSPSAIPWIEELAVHESRHVAQMQFGKDGLLGVSSWLFGELPTGAAAGIFPSTWMLEGDAVVAETALSDYGRGRDGAFLAYYMAAFDKGDRRSWTQWRWGSSRRYAPNHYALGYLTIAGARYLYNDPLFTSTYLKGAANHPLKLSKVRAWFKERSGKHFYDAFDDIYSVFHKQWKAGFLERGEAAEGQALTGTPSWYTSYSSPLLAGDDIYAVKSSLISPAKLVKLDKDGKEKSVMPFAQKSSGLFKAGNKVYWTEPVPDKRWSLAASSRLRVLSEDGSVKDLTRGGRYFNPAVSKDGKISVTEYPVEGGSAIVVLSEDGKELSRFKAPSGIQFTESAFVGDGIFVCYVGEKGMGLGRLKDNGIEEIIHQGPYTITKLKEGEGNLYFISGRDGAEEIYCLDAAGKTSKLFASKYGVTDFNIDGNNIVWMSREHEGNLPFKGSISNMPKREVSFLSWRRNAIADTLASQEKRLAKAAGIDLSAQWNGDISEPKSYNKFLNAFRFHSWLPLGIKYDAISDISDDSALEETSLGATVLFQNTLGTFSGLASYRYMEDELTGKGYRNAFHLSLTYSGLYPVIEAKLDIGERKAIQYGRLLTQNGQLSFEQTRGWLLDCPLVKAEINAYIPFNFSKGGWNKGVVPKLEYIISNDRFNTGAPLLGLGYDLSEIQHTTVFLDYVGGKNSLMQTITASVRAYTMRKQAPSQVFPSIGIGAEVGYRQRISLTKHFSPDLYWYLYGYLPGLSAEQGLKFTALGQHQFDATRFENVVKTRPRGLATDALNNWLAAYAPTQIRLTADYAIPIYLGDIDLLSPVTYIKNFVLTPHYDYTVLKFGHGFSGTGGLSSLGVDFTANVANILWFPYDSKIGISFCYNEGPSFSDIKKTGLPLDRTWIGMVFRTSL